MRPTEDRHDVKRKRKPRPYKPMFPRDDRHVFDNVGTRWVSAKVIAFVAGVPWQRAMRALHRLVEDGALQCELRTIRDHRARIRHRRFYRKPPPPPPLGEYGPDWFRRIFGNGPEKH